MRTADSHNYLCIGCIEQGYQDCCQMSNGTSCLGGPNLTCHCDYDCRFFSDCCADIMLTCPLANGEYIMFQDVYNIF